MRTRRDIKKAWFVMQLMLASNGLHDNEMKAINKTKFKFEKKLNEIDTIKESLEIINTRRALLHSNPELELIFRMFWILMQPYKDPITNIINEEGYIKFNIYIQYAVIGKKMNQNDALNVAKTDYLNDIASYGPLGQECFYDILLELIEMWSENTIIKFTIAFTWELLNSICDIRSYPPRFRSLKHVPCISLIDESEMLSRFSKSINQRNQLKIRVEWLESAHLSTEVYLRLKSRRNSVIITQETHDMIMIMLAHKEKNSISDDCEDDHQPVQIETLATYDCDDDEEVYYTNNGDDFLTPRFDIETNIDLADPLIHASTIHRLCPDIEVTHTISAAGSMKIASRLLNIAADARKTVQHSESLKQIEEEQSTTVQLSSPSILKWLRKVSYLVSALSSMESAEVSHQPPPPSPEKYKSNLFRITEKAKTPNDLEHTTEQRNNLPKKIHFRLDTPDPLIQRFTIDNPPKSTKQQLYSRRSSPTIPRHNQRGPHIIKSGQSLGYKMDDDVMNASLSADKAFEALSLENKSISSHSVTKVSKRNPKQIFGNFDGRSRSSHISSKPSLSLKNTQKSGNNLQINSCKSPVSDSMLSSDEENETKRYSIDHPNHSHHHNKTLTSSDQKKLTFMDDEIDSESLFIHDTNPGRSDIDNFECEYESRSNNPKENGENPFTVYKLHSQSQSIDQYDHIAVEITRPSKSSSGLRFLSEVDISNRESSQSTLEESNSLNQLPRNVFAVVDTRRVFSAKSNKRDDQSSDSRILRNLNDSLESSSHRFVPQPSPQQLIRPTSTGSIAMDQYYTKQYSNQLTQNLVTQSISSCIQPNHLKVPTHRSQSAKQYRMLRSPSSSVSRPSRKSSTLPSPLKPSQHSSKEKIFLNSARSLSDKNINNVSSSHPHTTQRRQCYGDDSPLFTGGKLDSIVSIQAHYMEGIGHLRPETYEGVQKSLRLVTYFTEDNYR